jgi:hypothetical protein
VLIERSIHHIFLSPSNAAGNKAALNTIKAKQLRRATMIRFTAFAATLAFAAMLSSVAAKADYYYGPVQNGNQCWNKQMTNGLANGGFGYWSECPKPASATVTRRTRHINH